MSEAKEISVEVEEPVVQRRLSSASRGAGPVRAAWA